jgi:hypothetical protein
MADWSGLDDKKSRQPRPIYGPATRIAITLVNIALLIGPMVASLVLMKCCGSGREGVLSGILAIGGLALSGTVAVLLMRYWSFAVTLVLRPRLLRKVESQYCVDLSQAHGAGVSPGDVVAAISATPTGT